MFDCLVQPWESLPYTALFWLNNKEESGQLRYLNATATAGTAPYSYLGGRRLKG